jgi:hypothetical protein
MKPWLMFVLCTVVCWGAYVPTLRHGQFAFGGGNGAFRAFLFVGLAYFLVGGAVFLYMLGSKAEPLAVTADGAVLSTLAGVLGAIGALGVIFALKAGGHHITVAPLIFAGAPIVNTFVSMAWDRPKDPPSVWFFAGIVLAALGAGLVLRFKP